METVLERMASKMEGDSKKVPARHYPSAFGIWLSCFLLIAFIIALIPFFYWSANWSQVNSLGKRWRDVQEGERGG